MRERFAWLPFDAITVGLHRTMNGVSLLNRAVDAAQDRAVDEVAHQAAKCRAERSAERACAHHGHDHELGHDPRSEPVQRAAAKPVPGSLVANTAA